MMRLVHAVVTTLIIAVAPVAAQQPAAKPSASDSSKDQHAVQPERPTVATHAGTVAPGWLEIETGVERDRVNPSASVISTPTVVKIGLASHLQLSLSGTVIRPLGAAAGVGDAAVGVKWRLVDDAPIVGDFAVLPAVKFPTGSAATGTTTTDASFFLISSHDLAGVAIDINAGYTHRSGNGQSVPTNATLWTVSFGGAFGGPVGWVAECYGLPATTGPAGQASIVALLGGPTLAVRTWLAFDAGVIIPVTGPQLRALYAGGVYNVGQLWGPRH